MILGKVYFSNGVIKPIVNYIIHGTYDVEFWTEDSHYHYVSFVEDREFFYDPCKIIQTIKYRTHYFYEITGKAVLAKIDHIDIFFGKGNE